MMIFRYILAATLVLGYSEKDYWCRFHGQCEGEGGQSLSKPSLRSVKEGQSLSNPSLQSVSRRLQKRDLFSTAQDIVSLANIPAAIQNSVVSCVKSLLDGADKKGLLKSDVDVSNPNADDANCPPEPSNRQKRDVIPPSTSGFERCVPLVSKNPIGNPYHPSLTGMDMENSIVRTGKGASYLLLGEGIECPQGGCKIIRSVSLAISNSKSVSINNGQDDMVSISNATNWSNGVSTSEMKSITDSLQQSNQHTDSSGTTESIANSFQETVSKTHFTATDKSHTTANQQSITEVTSWQHDNIQNQGSNDGFREDDTVGHDSSRGIENGNSASSSMSATNTAKATCSVALTFEEQASLKIPFLKVFELNLSFKATQSFNTELEMTVTRTATKTKDSHKKCSASSTDRRSLTLGLTHNQFSSSGTVDRIGGSSALMTGHSESDTVTHREGDSISDAISHGLTKTEGFRKDTSDMYGVVNGHTFGTNSQKGEVDNRGGALTNVSALTTKSSITNTNTSTETRTQQISFDMTLEAGSCWIPVCRPFVKSLITPWMCRNPNDPDTVTIMTTELQQAVEQTVDQPLVKCIVQVIPCDQQGKIGFTPSKTYRGPANEDKKKFLATGSILNGDDSHFLENGQFRFGFLPGRFGKPSNLAIYYADSDPSENAPKWESGILNVNATRLKLTQDGHIVQEAKGVFGGSDEWVSVWSNQPVNVNFPVGVYGKYGYRLYLTDQGELELIDGAEVMIWSTAKSKNKLGFKYPIEDIRPTTFVTESNAPGQEDPHNSMPSVEILPSSFLEKPSGDNCSTILNVKQAIKSSNGRFTLHLRESGNLVLRDGHRIMWETKTSDLYYSTPPYRALLSDFGHFQVKDSHNIVLWQTEVGGLEKFEVTNSGNLVGYYKNYTNDNKLDVLWSMRWKEVPTALSSGWSVFEHPFVECDKCSKCSIDTPAAPLYHLATGKCIMNPATNSCEFFKQDPSTKYYVSMNASSNIGFNCLGNTTSIFGQCNSHAAWRHYSDGFLTLQNFGSRCLDVEGKVVFCDNNKLRTDKLFSHGTLHSQLAELSTKPGHNRFFLLGHTLSSSLGNDLTLHPNGDLLLRKQSKWKWVRSYKTLNYTPMMVLGDDGSLKVTDLSGTRSDVTLSKPSSGGVGPYTLKMEDDMAILRDSRGLPIWKLGMDSELERE